MRFVESCLLLNEKKLIKLDYSTVLGNLTFKTCFEQKITLLNFDQGCH